MKKFYYREGERYITHLLIHDTPFDYFEIGVVAPTKKKAIEKAVLYYNTSPKDIKVVATNKAEYDSYLKTMY